MTAGGAPAGPGGTEVSVWLCADDADEVDALPRLVGAEGVLGVVCGPRLAASPEEPLTAALRQSCDALEPVLRRTDGCDGRVVVPLPAILVHDVDALVGASQRLASVVDRPGLLVAVPASDDGLHAVSHLIARGLDVAATDVFCLDRLRGVLNAVLTGLEQAREAGIDCSAIRTVVTVGVGPFGAEVDRRLRAVASGSDEAQALRGRAALAHARLAAQACREVLATPRWATLAASGACPPRLLWQGLSSPDYPRSDGSALALRIDELHARSDTPPASSCAKTGDDPEHADAPDVTASEEVLDDIERLGVGYRDVVEMLERAAREHAESAGSASSVARPTTSGDGERRIDTSETHADGQADRG